MKIVPLTQEKRALIDDEDYDLVKDHKWCAQKIGRSWYATTNIGGRKNHKILLMHRVIMDAPINKQVDHINHDGLDNRRCNLRLCTKSQNGANQYLRGGISKYKGVIWNKQVKKWMARIRVNYDQKYIGVFTDEKEAARAYNQAAQKYFGEFAYLNQV